MAEYRAYVGLDIHKHTIAAGVAGSGGSGVSRHDPEPESIATTSDPQTGRAGQRSVELPP